MDLYCRFLCGDVVVNIRNEQEYHLFVERCKDLKLKPIIWFAKYDFAAHHRNAGIQVISFGDLCVEFQASKGFTCGSSTEYKDWGSEIISFDDFIKETE